MTAKYTVMVELSDRDLVVLAISLGLARNFYDQMPGLQIPPSQGHPVKASEVDELKAKIQAQIKRKKSANR